VFIFMYLNYDYYAQFEELINLQLYGLTHTP
jgi:hypothetical protein